MITGEIMSKIDISKTLYSGTPREKLMEFTRREELLTGIPSIDKDFGFPTGYYVIIGNPGTGKSWFALWLSRKFYIHHQLSSVYFSLEMPEWVVRSRILQQWSDITKSQLEAGNDTSQALTLIEKDAIVVNTFHSEDQGLQTPEIFEQWIEEYYSVGYRIFHFDHLHELAGANTNERNQGLTEKWAKMFQQICKNHSDIWLIVYAQPNGAAANKKVLRRTDIAGSKAITQKCDFTLSLNRNFEIDPDTGIVKSDDDQRNIILFLDKTRYTEKAHIAFKLYFAQTGNFFQIMEANHE